MSKTKGISERRSEKLLDELLSAQGWSPKKPPVGDVLLQNEYAAFPLIEKALKQASKTGGGSGYPEALLVDKVTEKVLAVVEAKKLSSEHGKALREAQHYAERFKQKGYAPLAIGLAGTSDDSFELRVSRYADGEWSIVTYGGKPVSWIPNRADLERVASPHGRPELRPTIPPPEVLARRAEEINRLLREAKIKDEFRPAVVAAIMLALASSKGRIRRDEDHILSDINAECLRAFEKAGKPALGRSLHVEEANAKLATRAVEIARILEKLNVSVLTAEHDYLGQLYETFFRYTGGNTIGQYFTPRHIAQFMADVCEVGPRDHVLDPACGTGGFLVAAMDRLLRAHDLSRAEMVKVARKQLYGFETEPVTAALCVANMILRGDGATQIHQEDCFTAPDFPEGNVDVVLMNPPFPHKASDTPSEDFVDRALEALKHRGKVAVVLPTSLIVKKSKGAWRQKILKHHRLLAVCQLPDELFQPYASATTSVVVLEKGVKHDPSVATVFVRLHHDGLTLRKGIRVERPTEPNDIPQAVDAIVNKRAIPGFSGLGHVSGEREWAAGAYVASAPPSREEVQEAVDVHLRRLASFYTRYAREVTVQRDQVRQGAIRMAGYRSLMSQAKKDNAKALSDAARPGTIGDAFDIVYGMKELHSRDGIADGETLVISPTEAYNGCYGWLEFGQVMQPPFVTVAQTGSIGEAFVQFEPCAVNDDCLVLLPRKTLSEAMLVIAAACLHEEKWRFSYGRKLTPARIAEFVLPNDPVLEAWVEERLAQTRRVVLTALTGYAGAEDAAFFIE
ncbi:SAM-dependent methyltransferase [Luteibacter aegosomaticola]|uniref:HsdM family class I SAM-dependent methyltransferase n=1 Tax=Luteibacter aegosomaticola TaxID=2911538 RepID=UPI001FF91FDD|nr:N-6 DNA methylase [Luteibacter aegosomaticola]UPG90721.1 SAM-dependent methyltransferase [Luteibacter aegosomaticola]